MALWCCAEQMSPAVTDDSIHDPVIGLFESFVMISSEYIDGAPRRGNKLNRIIPDDAAPDMERMRRPIGVGGW